MFRCRPAFLFVGLVSFSALAANSRPMDEVSSLDTEISIQESSRIEFLLSAGSITGFQGRYIEAFSQVELKSQDKVFKADYLKYDLTSSSLSASGGILVDSERMQITGDKLSYSIPKHAGEIINPEYLLKDHGARGKADKIIAESSTKFVVRNGTYTTCDAGAEDWYLEVEELKIDQASDLGVAKNTFVRFKDSPILYAPYLDFSVSGSRKSGLLPPSAGQTNQSGTEFKLPYYWNIAPNMDATVTPRIMSRRGVQINQEFRYLSEILASTVRTEYLGDDDLLNDSRWAYVLAQQYSWGQKLSANISLQSVSDDSYFTDLSDNINATSLTNLPRELGINYDGGWYNAGLRVQNFRTLQDPLNLVTPPYERVPQFRLFGTKKLNIGSDIEFRGEVVDFDHPTLLNARRDVFYPSLKWPIRKSYAYITPKVGYHYSRYTMEDSNAASERQVPIYSIDSGMTFERSSTLFGKSFLQTLEPRLYYVYIPFRSQEDLPIFDTAESDFNLAQIFTENIFTGADRINDADQITAAVTSRYLSNQTGEEELRLTLAQRYYFSDQRVGLDSNYVPRASNRSDVLMGIDGRLNASLKTNIIAQYSLVEDQWERSSVMFYYQPDLDKLINVGYRFTRDSVEQLDAAMQWSLFKNWSGLVRWNFSTRDKQLIEGVIGLEREAGCWKTRLVAHRFASSTDEYATSFFLQLELTGLSKLGINPIDVLKQNIKGYGKK